LNEIKQTIKELESKNDYTDLINTTKEGRGRQAIHFAAARGDEKIFDYIYEMTSDKNT
jgi:hypothetical protein